MALSRLPRSLGKKRFWLAFTALPLLSIVQGEAHAQDAGAPAVPTTSATEPAPPPATPAQTTPAPTTAPPDTVPHDARVAHPESTQRMESLVPKPAEAHPEPGERAKFEADPMRDGSIVAIGLGFNVMLQLIISTGEVRPQQIARDFDTQRLLFIDRGAIRQNFDDSAKTYSNIGLYTAVGFAMLDPILSSVREQSKQTGLVDAIIYAESLTIAWGVTNLAKIAVRRPRPRAYTEFELHRNDVDAQGNPTFENQSTDSSLSFFSGHASICAATTATATYLAFARSPGTFRPWLTLIVGSVITGFVSYGRVTAGDHFPTDVIAGALAGAGIGVLVPHFHRSETVKQRPVWVGFAPAGRGDGGSLTFAGHF